MMEVKSPDSLDYQFFPVQTFRKNISIKAPHDAHLSLTSEEGDSTPMVEIFLGAWDNTKSAIRFNQEKVNVAEEETPGLLSRDEHRDFTIEWTQNGTLVQVYGGDDKTPFLSWRNSQTFPITHFGVRTCREASGEWVIDGISYMATVDSMEYNYSPIEPYGGRVDLTVRARNDAHVSLTNGPSAEIPIHEIFLGRSEDQKCAIQHNREKPEVAQFEAPGILSDEEYKGFWIEWNYKEIRVGIANAPDAFMEWPARISHPVTFFGIRTAHGSEGTWYIPSSAVGIGTGAATLGGELAAANAQAPTGNELQDEFGWVDPNAHPRGNRVSRADPKIPLDGFDWVASKGGDIVPDAVRGGEDGGEPTFVARAKHEADLIPGKLVPSHQVVYVAHGGGEHGKEEYEVLVAPAASVSWVAESDGGVPDNAIPGGMTENGETLFIGRTNHAGALTTGKIHPSHGSLYISYGGEEIGFSDYEVLVKN